MSLVVIDKIDSLPTLGVQEDDEAVVVEDKAIYRRFDLSTITSYSWDFTPNDTLDTGSAFSSLSAGSNDSFSIEFFSNRKTTNEVTIFSAGNPRIDSVVDLSSESNSIRPYGLTSAVKFGAYTSSPTSVYLESSLDFMSIDSSIDSLSLFAPFTIEFWYNKYNTSPSTGGTKDVIFGANNKSLVDVLTIDEAGIIVNNIRYSGNNAYTQNTWEHTALTYDGFNYGLFKNGDSIPLVMTPNNDVAYEGQTGDGGISYSHDSGFMTIFEMDRRRSSSWQVRTTMSPTDKTLFYMGSVANRVQLQTINSGANLKLSAGDVNGPELIVAAPSDGKVHTISWDVQTLPGRVRLWIDSNYQGSNSIAAALPANQWAITEIANVPELKFTRSSTMLDSSTKLRTDGAQYYDSAMFPYSTFNDESDGTYNYYVAYPLVQKEEQKAYGYGAAWRADRVKSYTRYQEFAAGYCGKVDGANQYHNVDKRFGNSILNNYNHFSRGGDEWIAAGKNIRAINGGQLGDWLHVPRMYLSSLGEHNWYYRTGWTRTTSGSNYVTVNNISIIPGGDQTYYFEMDKSKNPLRQSLNGYGVPTEKRYVDPGRWYGDQQRAYLTMVATSKLARSSAMGDTPELFKENINIAMDNYYPRNGAESTQVNFGYGYISGDFIRTSHTIPARGTRGAEPLNATTGHTDDEFFLGGFFLVNNKDNADVSYIISEPDNRVYYFANSVYLGYLNFPSSVEPYTVIIHKGHNMYYYGNAHNEESPSLPVRNLAGYYPPYGSYHHNRWGRYYERSYYYSGPDFIWNRHNIFKKLRVDQNSWVYDPVTQMGLIPSTDRNSTASGDGAFGMDSLGDSWEGSLKSNLMYNTQLYTEYKDANVTVGESIRNNLGETTGLEYATAYVAKTGGTVVTYSGANGSNIRAAIDLLSEGDALVLPSGAYDVSGEYDGRYYGLPSHGEDNRQAIWRRDYVGFLVCGETNNPNDVHLTARGVDRIFNGNASANAQIAFCHFILTGSTSYWYGDVIADNAIGRAFRCIFNFNNGYQGWRLGGQESTSKIIFENCLFINYRYWYAAGRNNPNPEITGRVDLITVKNCIFQRGVGPAFRPDLPTVSPSFVDNVLQNQKTLDANLTTRTNPMSEWILSDYTAGSKKRFLQDFMIHDINKYPLAFSIDSRPSTNDSNTNFILGARVTDVALSYGTDGIIKHGLQQDSIHSVVSTPGEWIHTSLNYSGDSNVLRTYIEGIKVDSSLININIDALSTSTISFNKIDSYNPSTNNYDVTSGSFYLKEFRLVKGQRRSGDDFSETIIAQVASAADQVQAADDIFMTKHDGSNPLDLIISPYTADVKSWRKVAIMPRGIDSAYIEIIDGNSMLELQEADDYRPVRQIGIKYESDGSGNSTAIQESDGSYNGTITGYYHTQTIHPDSSLAFARSSFVITLKDSDDNGDSIHWSYSIENYNNNILQIGRDSHNTTFYLKAYDITESNMNLSSSLRFFGKSTDSVNKRPIMGSLDRPIDSSATDIHINFGYDGNLGLDIAYLGDKQYMRLITIDSISSTFDSSGFVFDALPSITGGII